jgi:hypothetical protein
MRRQLAIERASRNEQLAFFYGREVVSAHHRDHGELEAYWQNARRRRGDRKLLQWWCSSTLG